MIFGLLDFFRQNNIEYPHVHVDASFPLNPNSNEETILPGTLLEDPEEGDDPIEQEVDNQVSFLLLFFPSSFPLLFFNANYC